MKDKIPAFLYGTGAGCLIGVLAKGLIVLLLLGCIAAAAAYVYFKKEDKSIPE